jgi:hypothetical protein
VPGVGVARPELAEQRGELPAERERDADDDEPQRTDPPVGGGGREGLFLARTAQRPIERRALGRIRGRREHVGDAAARKRFGRLAEERDDAHAAFRDDPVGRAQDVAAIGQGQQRLLDVGIGGHGRGELLALKAHGGCIGS